MEIADWLVKNKMSLKKLAKLAKISPSTLYAAFQHKRAISGPSAERIYKVTNRAVSVHEAANPDRKPFRDERKQCKKPKILCGNCGEEVKLSRSYLKRLASQKDTSKE